MPDAFDDNADAFPSRPDMGGDTPMEQPLDGPSAAYIKRGMIVLAVAGIAGGSMVAWATDLKAAMPGLEFVAWLGLIAMVTFIAQRLIRNVLIDELWISMLAVLMIASTGGARWLTTHTLDLGYERTLIVVTILGTLMQLLRFRDHFKWVGAADPGVGSI